MVQRRPRSSTPSRRRRSSRRSSWTPRRPRPSTSRRRRSSWTRRRSRTPRRPRTSRRPRTPRRPRASRRGRSTRVARACWSSGSRGSSGRDDRLQHGASPRLRHRGRAARAHSAPPKPTAESAGRRDAGRGRAASTGGREEAQRTRGDGEPRFWIRRASSATWCGRHREAEERCGEVDKGEGRGGGPTRCRAHATRSARAGPRDHRAGAAPDEQDAHRGSPGDPGAREGATAPDNGVRREPR